MSNPAEVYIARMCPTDPDYVTGWRDFVSAFRRWLSEVAPKLLREWTAARLAQLLATFNLRIAYEDGRTVVRGIRPFVR